MHFFSFQDVQKSDGLCLFLQPEDGLIHFPSGKYFELIPTFYLADFFFYKEITLIIPLSCICSCCWMCISIKDQVKVVLPFKAFTLLFLRSDRKVTNKKQSCIIAAVSYHCKVQNPPRYCRNIVMQEGVDKRITHTEEFPQLEVQLHVSESCHYLTIQRLAMKNISCRQLPHCSLYLLTQYVFLALKLR